MCVLIRLGMINYVGTSNRFDTANLIVTKVLSTNDFALILGAQLTLQFYNHFRATLEYRLTIKPCYHLPLLIILICPLLNVSWFTFLCLAGASVPEVDEEVQLHFMIASERAKYEATWRSHVQFNYVIRIY